ncbi:MAG: preprotein translocase subunit YajC [Bacteroidetes bacterium]|nr:MAG: preprotein translocase subunit YajC [Bacteroidota bacterium]
MKSKLTYLVSIITAVSVSGCVDPNAQQGKGAGGGLGPLIFLPLMILVFWLFFIRPQSKRQKSQKSFVDNLQRGDKVVTIAGIHGTINKINEDGTIMLEISPGSYLKMEKSSISMEMTTQLNKAGTAEKK